MILLLQILAAVLLTGSGLFLTYKVCIDAFRGWDNGGGGLKIVRR